MTVQTRDSAGYNGLMNSPLARPEYKDQIMAHYEERDFLADITNSSINEQITNCGQLVQILCAPKVPKWRTYSVNQPMTNSQVSITAICLSICNAAYQSIKFDTLTINAACTNWPLFEAAFLEANYESYAAFQRDWVFSHMIAAAARENQGNAAGQKRNLPLGAKGAPRIVTRQSIALDMSYLRQCLVEHRHWVNGQMFLVVPPDFYTVLANSNYANASWIGGGRLSTQIDGAWVDQVMGFNIFESIYLPSILDNSKLCYYVLAGHRDAYTYATNIVQARLMEDLSTFGIMYQMLGVWGGAPLYPQFLAVGYWSFDPAA
jgi:hypothetical protein